MAKLFATLRANLPALGLEPLVVGPEVFAIAFALGRLRPALVALDVCHVTSIPIGTGEFSLLYMQFATEIFRGAAFILSTQGKQRLDHGAWRKRAV